ncbi:MAG: Cys-tRNA(Pro) deacylase [Selenomonas artemidis]|uniref:Cys-tRNA(Pro) deacylase n=1 Tax=Selenomonas sp. FOBRC9 TaxID=936573 RepID=UPI00027A6344|nr:Cys-tRNA(Pro) deacylase [Selenomonas sp. FOBRC9]EJP31486.1 YbaK/EbsC protein [Selenomonas sp. FOBRC9]MBF1682593.1 Cys-tRNA(Pro) deacylase [Selenomonas artemidis]
MAKKKIQKTNAARILDRCGISYELLTYPVDESDLSAVHVAEVTGIPLERLYKTLVVRGDRTGIFMAVVPGGGELDLKAAAAASGNKRAEMVHLKEVFDLTGYVRGGCSPLGAKKAYPVYLDESALAHERICISAGRRGEQIELAPGDLVRAADAVTVKIER